MTFNVEYRYECADCGHILITDEWPDECPACADRRRERAEVAERREARKNASVARMPDGAGGYQYAPYYGQEWQDVREEALRRDGHECQSCGLTHEDHKADDSLFGEGLHVHHIQKACEFDDPRDANRLENLVSLCATCHRKSEHV